MTYETKAVGEYGERVAEQHLLDQGLVVLARNWRCAEGEVDLILRDGPAVVFCEVKTRRGDAFDSPEESVGPAKVRRLRRVAACWLAESMVRAGEVRFDVVGVLPQPRGRARIDHTRSAF